MNEGAVVLLSGGMDSGIAALLAKARAPVHALTFEYGQRHWVELAAAKRIAGIIGVESHLTVNVGAQGIGIPSALVTAGKGPITGASAVVPGRNQIFLTYAAARAQMLGVRFVIIGCCEDDAAVFPDCRPEFLAAAQHALRLGLGFPELAIGAPFVGSRKAVIVECARKMKDGFDVLRASWSCYSPKQSGTRAGDVVPCAECSACVARAKGFAEAHADDPQRNA